MRGCLRKTTEKARRVERTQHATNRRRGTTPSRRRQHEDDNPLCPSMAGEVKRSSGGGRRSWMSRSFILRYRYPYSTGYLRITTGTCTYYSTYRVRVPELTAWTNCFTRSFLALLVLIGAGRVARQAEAAADPPTRGRVLLARGSYDMGGAAGLILQPPAWGRGRSGKRVMRRASPPPHTPGALRPSASSCPPFAFLSDSSRKFLELRALDFFPSIRRRAGEHSCGCRVWRPHNG